jgi:hypothetical protein
LELCAISRPARWRLLREEAAVIDLVREYGVLRFGGMTAAFLFVLASFVLVMASHG